MTRGKRRWRGSGMDFWVGCRRQDCGGAHEAVNGAWGERGKGGIVERLSISDAACRVMGWGASRGEMRRIPGNEPAYRLKKRI